MQDLDCDFFRQRPSDCARRLIGAEFHWDGCAGRIVETEAYSAENDPACHTFFRPSTRRFVEDHEAGTAYVYLNYGVHWLFNILVKSGEEVGFVLLRALEPRLGIEEMRRRRHRSKSRDLCSGPGKLTQALGIDGADHATSFLGADSRGIRLGKARPCLVGPRIGISRGVDIPWRFGCSVTDCLSQPFKG
jgi:DNA-3-methyladenine glycosylase